MYKIICEVQLFSTNPWFNAITTDIDIKFVTIDQSQSWKLTSHYRRKDNNTKHQINEQMALGTLEGTIIRSHI